MKKILVVGAGFAGATMARELAEAGYQVLVIDKRNHIGGNAYDYVNELGIRVHKYGPHLWHTSNEEVQEWASRFTEWVPYQHKVMARLPDGRDVPLPINRDTIEMVFGERLQTWAEKSGHYDWSIDIYRSGVHAAFLESLVEHHADVTNSRQHVENSVGKELCDLFFAPYTKKMWGLELDQLPASVTARIPTNVEGGSDLYFPKDKYQVLPAEGYTVMFENILDHKNITVLTKTSRQELLDPKLSVYWETQLGWHDLDFDHVFSSEPIDTYFHCSLGALPWRSIKMHVMNIPLPYPLPSAVLNFTNDGPYTRVTEWQSLPAHGTHPYMTTVTFEEPCDYQDNDKERYYPVKTSSVDCPNIALYKRYKAMAEESGDVTFIGRCGMYVYSDMHQVISTTLSIARKFIKENE